MAGILLNAILGLTLLAATSAGGAPATADWQNISDPLVQQLQADGKKEDWPGQTAGVACDATTGDVFLVLPGQGLWKSSDRGKSFARVDGGAIGGRCETSFSLNMDPQHSRLACFMLDGKCALTPDAGKTWRPMSDLGRNWDYAAVDWSGPTIANILGERHEVGGEVYLSTDAGRSWKLLFKDATFDRAGGLGIFDATTLLRAFPGRGIERSTDAGASWKKVSDFQPDGRVMKVFGGRAYWLSPDGLLASDDRGQTWNSLGDKCPGTIGPMLDPQDRRHLAIAGKDGIFETRDGGKTWKFIAPLPPKFDVPRPGGWFTNVAWNPMKSIYYASRMGMPAYKLEATAAADHTRVMFFMDERGREHPVTTPQERSASSRLTWKRWFRKNDPDGVRHHPHVSAPPPAGTCLTAPKACPSASQKRDGYWRYS